MARTSSHSGPRESVAVRFRREITEAETAGRDLSQLTLNLTLGDVARLRRDPSVALTDIAFTDGGMRFMGVPVVAGGVDQSRLSLAD